MVNCVNGKVAGLDSNSSAQLDRVQSKVQDNFRNFLTDFFFSEPAPISMAFDF